MSEYVIPFQQRRFQDAAPHYLQGRPPYGAAPIRRVAKLTGLALQHRVLDLGCGPASLPPVSPISPDRCRQWIQSLRCWHSASSGPRAR
jgi:hypothetical protein